MSNSPGEEDVARVARGVQREAQLERGGRLQGARRHPRHDRQRPGHRRRPARDQEEAMPHVLKLLESLLCFLSGDVTHSMVGKRHREFETLPHVIVKVISVVSFKVSLKTILRVHGI